MTWKGNGSMSFQVYTYGDPAAETMLVQMVDYHDMEGIENEFSKIRELTGGQDFCLKAVKIDDWNKDLSPWVAPAVFGNEDFGEGAADTLRFLRQAGQKIPISAAIPSPRCLRSGPDIRRTALMELQRHPRPCGSRTL